MNDPRVSYEEHRDFLSNEAGLMDAELSGFMDARLFDAPRKVYRSVQFQDRYNKGFRDGKAKMMQDEVTA